MHVVIYFPDIRAKKGDHCNIELVLENYLDLLSGGFPSGWIKIGYHYGNEIFMDCDRYNKGKAII
jgi:hypothetical protein